MDFLVTNQTHKLFCGNPFEAYEKRFKIVHSIYVRTKDKGLNIRSCTFYPKSDSRLASKSMFFHCYEPGVTRKK